MHVQPSHTSKLVTYAADFTVAGTLTESNILWNIFCNLGQKFEYYLQVSI